MSVPDVSVAGTGNLLVVCPFTTLHPLTRRALDEYAAYVRYVDLGPQTDAYWKLLSELWTAGKSFLLVEHDIEIRADVIPQLEECPEPWCLFGYYGSGNSFDLLTHSLGCTRFRSELMRDVPALLVDLPSHNPGIQANDWRRLDAEIYPRLRDAGYTPHVHEPHVDHHHFREGRCDCKREHE